MRFKRTCIRGISSLGVIVLIFAIAGGYVGWSYYQKKQSQAAHEAAVATANSAMDKSKAQWMDALRLATSTPRIGLAGPMGTLQAIRQGVRQLEVPECLAQNKQHLITGMNEAMDGMLAFMRNDMGKYELDDFTTQKVQAMTVSFAEFDKKPVHCAQKKK